MQLIIIKQELMNKLFNKIKDFFVFVFTKGSFYLKAQTILTTYIVIGAFIVIPAMGPFYTDNQFKKYIIKHQDEIIREDEDSFRLYTDDLKYWEEVTLHGYETYYTIVFWGDRDTWKWFINLDHKISEDIEYKKHKGENIELDKQILDILINK